ncbi:hypothetical protein D1P53_001551 [Cryptococcus gattii VGV]|nr:hypothetical protein D1P53_001551 [Cryptococcus gattii VGV]
MDYQENSNNSGTSTNNLRQRMMDYLIRTEQTTRPEPFTYILHKAPFDAQAYEAEEEVDQHLGYLSDFASVSTASPRQSPQSPITWSDVPSGMTWDNSELERQSAFGYPTAWRNRCDSTEDSIQVPIMTDRGIVYQAAEEECDFLSTSKSLTRFSVGCANPATNGRHQSKDSFVGL